MSLKYIVILVLMIVLPGSNHMNKTVTDSDKEMVVKRADISEADPILNACKNVWEVTIIKEVYYIGTVVPVVFETKGCVEGGDYICPLSVCPDDTRA